MAHLIEFKNFSVYYKQKKDYVVAVDEVTFEVEEGEFLVLAGPSGCGKTTILKSMMGVSEHTTGEVKFRGEDLSAVCKADSQMAYVSQEYSLYPTMTVYENIAFPLRMMHAPHEEIDKRVRKIAEELELDWLLSRKPKQLSEGQHQRVAIARALIKKPRILLFDEPFANLHPELRMKMRTLVKKIHIEQRVTAVLVTHDWIEAMELADRIVVMDAGAIVQIGTPYEIQRHPKSHLIRELFTN